MTGIRCGAALVLWLSAPLTVLADDSLLYSPSPLGHAVIRVTVLPPDALVDRKSSLGASASAIAPAAVANRVQNASSSPRSRKGKIAIMLVSAAAIGAGVYLYSHPPALYEELVGTREVPCRPPPPNLQNPPTQCVEPVYETKRDRSVGNSFVVLGAVGVVVSILTW